MRYLMLLLFLLALPASAQTVVERMTCGAISGTVVDDLGDPLPGASVLVAGTALGAATDFDGNYVIDCVPAGTYDVTASFVGYPSITVSGVPVRKLSIRGLDFELVEGNQFADCCFCYSGPPIISTDPYASRVLTGEEIERLPVGR